jgi:hypothetical protein
VRRQSWDGDFALVSTQVVAGHWIPKGRRKDRDENSNDESRDPTSHVLLHRQGGSTRPQAIRGPFASYRDFAIRYPNTNRKLAQSMAAKGL